MYKILLTGSIREIGLYMPSKEKDIEIQYTPDLPLTEIFKIISPFHCILSRSETSISKELIEKATKLKVIDQFQLAGNKRGGKAKSLIRVDDDLHYAVVKEISN